MSPAFCLHCFVFYFFIRVSHLSRLTKYQSSPGRLMVCVLFTTTNCRVSFGTGKYAKMRVFNVAIYPGSDLEEERLRMLQKSGGTSRNTAGNYDLPQRTKNGENNDPLCGLRNSISNPVEIRRSQICKKIK